MEKKPIYPLSTSIHSRTRRGDYQNRQSHIQSITHLPLNFFLSLIIKAELLMFCITPSIWTVSHPNCPQMPSHVRRILAVVSNLFAVLYQASS